MSSNFVSVAFPMGESLSESDIEEVYNTGMDTGGLDFSGADLSGDQPYFIADLLASNKMISIVHIDLSHTKTTLEGFEAILFAAMEIKSLESFVAKSLSLPKEAGMSLAKLVASKGCLKILDVSCNDLGDVGLSNLSGAFSADHSKVMTKQLLSVVTLSVLDLSFNNLGDAGVLGLCRGLSQFVRRAASVGVTPALKVLKLNNNNITDKAAICLAQLINYRTDSSNALSPSPKAGFSNTLHLDELGLSDNPLTSRGIVALLGSASEGVVSPLKRLCLANTGVDSEVLDHLAQVLRTDTNLVQVDLSCSAQIAAELVQQATTGSVTSTTSIGTHTLYSALNSLCSAIIQYSNLSLSLGFLHRTLYTQAVYLTRTNTTDSTDIVRTLETCNHPSVCAALGLVLVPNVRHWLRSAEYTYAAYSAAYNEAVELCVEEERRAKHNSKWQSNPMRDGANSSNNNSSYSMGVANDGVAQVPHSTTPYTTNALPTTTTSATHNTTNNTTSHTTTIHNTTADSSDEYSLEAVLKQDARSLLSALRGLSPEGRAALNVPVVGTSGGGSGIGSSAVNGGVDGVNGSSGGSGVSNGASIAFGGADHAALPTPPTTTTVVVPPPQPTTLPVVSPVKKSNFLSTFHGGVMGVLTSVDGTSGTNGTSASGNSAGGAGSGSVGSTTKTPRTSTATPIMTLPSNNNNTSSYNNTSTIAGNMKAVVDEQEFKQLSAERTTALRHLSTEIDRLAHISPSTVKRDLMLSPDNNNNTNGHVYGSGGNTGVNGSGGSIGGGNSGVVYNGSDVYGGMYSPVYSAEYTPVKSTTHTPVPQVLTPLVHTYTPDGDLYSIYNSPPVHTNMQTNPMNRVVFSGASGSNDSGDSDTYRHPVVDVSEHTPVAPVVNTSTTNSTSYVHTTPVPATTYTNTTKVDITPVPTTPIPTTTTSIPTTTSPINTTNNTTTNTTTPNTAIDPNLVQIIGYMQAKISTMETSQTLYVANFTTKFSALECRVEAVEAALKLNSDVLSSIQQGQDKILELLNSRGGVERGANSGGEENNAQESDGGQMHLSPSRSNQDTPTHPTNTSVLTSPLPHSYIPNELLITDLLARLEVVEGRLLTDRAAALQAVLAKQLHSEREAQRVELGGGSVVGGGGGSVRSPQFVGSTSVASAVKDSGMSGVSAGSVMGAIGGVYSPYNTQPSGSMYSAAQRPPLVVPPTPLTPYATATTPYASASHVHVDTASTISAATFPANAAGGSGNSMYNANPVYTPQPSVVPPVSPYIPNRAVPNTNPTPFPATTGTADNSSGVTNPFVPKPAVYSSTEILTTRTPQQQYTNTNTSTNADTTSTHYGDTTSTYNTYTQPTTYINHTTHTTQPSHNEWSQSLENLAQYDPHYEEKGEQEAAQVGFEPATSQVVYGESVPLDYDVHSQLTNNDHYTHHNGENNGVGSENKNTYDNYSSGGEHYDSNNDNNGASDNYMSNGECSENESVYPYDDVVMHTPYAHNGSSGAGAANNYNTNTDTTISRNIHSSVGNSVQSDIRSSSTTLNNQRPYNSGSSGNADSGVYGSNGGIASRTVDSSNVYANTARTSTNSSSTAEPLSRAAATFQRLQNSINSTDNNTASNTYNNTNTTSTTSTINAVLANRTSLPVRSTSNPRGRFVNNNSGGSAANSSSVASNTTRSNRGSTSTTNSTTTNNTNTTPVPATNKPAASPYIAANYYAFDALDTPLVTMAEHSSDEHVYGHNNTNTNHSNTNNNTNVPVHGNRQGADYQRLISSRDNTNPDTSMNYSIINNNSRTSISMADDTLNTLNDSVSLLGQDVHISRNSVGNGGNSGGNSNVSYGQYRNSVGARNNAPVVTYTTQNNTINTFTVHPNNTNTTTNNAHTTNTLNTTHTTNTLNTTHTTSANSSKGRSKSPHFMRPTASNAIKAASNRPVSSSHGVEHR